MDKDNNCIGLALSGGGYRAAAYHLGTLRALHRLGILEKIDVISSISGGSITAAYYAINKNDYDQFEKSLIEKLKTGVIFWTIVCAIVEGLLLMGIHVALVWGIINANISQLLQSTIIVLLCFVFYMLLLLFFTKLFQLAV